MNTLAALAFMFGVGWIELAIIGLICIGPLIAVSVR